MEGDAEVVDHRAHAEPEELVHERVGEVVLHAALGSRQRQPPPQQPLPHAHIAAKSRRAPATVAAAAAAAAAVAR